MIYELHIVSERAVVFRRLLTGGVEGWKGGSWIQAEQRMLECR